MIKKLADNPKDSLEAFLDELRDDYSAWYEKSVRRIHLTWLPIQLTALFSGFAASILAAVMTEEMFKAGSVFRVLLILLPALGAAASTLTAQARLHEWCRLRENGRRAIQDLINDGKLRFAASKTDEEYSSIHREIVRKVSIIEDEQGVGWFSLASPRTSVIT